MNTADEEEVVEAKSVEDDADEPVPPSKYICRGCQYAADTEWCGRCPGCGFPYNKIKRKAASKDSTILDTRTFKPPKRFSSGLPQLDQVLGANIDPKTGLIDEKYGYGFALSMGHTIILGGVGGLGKTTLCMRICQYFTEKGKVALYASGEESKEQVAGVAYRCGLVGNKRFHVIGNEGDAYVIGEKAEELGVKILVVDSLQTAFCSDASGAEGSLSQLENSTNYFTALAKTRKMIVIFLSHLNKQEEFRVPKSVEHIVDTVMLLALDEIELDEDGEVIPIDDSEGRPVICMCPTGKNRFMGKRDAEARFWVTPTGIREREMPAENPRRMVQLAKDGDDVSRARKRAEMLRRLKEGKAED